jgi:hypothetical protein
MLKRTQSPNYEQNLQDALEDLRKDPTLLIAREASRRGIKESTLRDRKNKEHQNSMSAHSHKYLLSPV